MEISQVQDSIREERETLSQRQGLVKEIIERKATERLEAERDKTELIAKLPAILTDVALGRASRSEIVKAKKRLRECDEIAKDFPFIENGLNAELTRLSNRQGKVNGREYKLQKYLAKKEEIQGDYHNRNRDIWEARLLSMAKDPALDCLEDATQFLEGLKKPK